MKFFVALFFALVIVFLIFTSLFTVGSLSHICYDAFNIGWNRGGLPTAFIEMYKQDKPKGVKP